MFGMIVGTTVATLLLLAAACAQAPIRAGEPYNPGGSPGTAPTEIAVDLFQDGDVLVGTMYARVDTPSPAGYVRFLGNLTDDIDFSRSNSTVRLHIPKRDEMAVAPFCSNSSPGGKRSEMMASGYMQSWDLAKEMPKPIWSSSLRRRPKAPIRYETSVGVNETYQEVDSMTNVQVRLLAAAVALIAGTLAASTDNLNVNVGIAIILVSGALFLAEYVRCQRS